MSAAAAEMEKLRQMLVRYATRFDREYCWRKRKSRSHKGRKRRKPYCVPYRPTLGDLYSCDRAEEDITAAIAEFRREREELGGER